MAKISFNPIPEQAKKIQPEKQKSQTFKISLFLVFYGINAFFSGVSKSITTISLGFALFFLFIAAGIWIKGDNRFYKVDTGKFDDWMGGLLLPWYLYKTRDTKRAVELCFAAIGITAVIGGIAFLFGYLLSS